MFTVDLDAVNDCVEAHFPTINATIESVWIVGVLTDGLKAVCIYSYHDENLEGTFFMAVDLIITTEGVGVLTDDNTLMDIGGYECLEDAVKDIQKFNTVSLQAI